MVASIVNWQIVDFHCQHHWQKNHWHWHWQNAGHCLKIGTDLGNLIGNLDCGCSTVWFSNFLLLWFFREINFIWFQKVKAAILTIWTALNFEFLGTFDNSKCEIILTIKIQSLQNRSNGSFWPSEIRQNQFHVKSNRQENSLISTLCSNMPLTLRHWSDAIPTNVFWTYTIFKIQVLRFWILMSNKQ